MSEEELYEFIWTQLDELDDATADDRILLAKPEGVSEQQFCDTLEEVVRDRNSEGRTK